MHAISARHDPATPEPWRVDAPRAAVPSLPASLLRGLSVVAVLTLVGTAAFLLWRRFSGAMEHAPGAPEYISTAALLILLAGLARAAWSLQSTGGALDRRHPVLDILVAASVVFSGLAISFERTAFHPLFAFWLVLVAEELLWLVPWRDLTVPAACNARPEPERSGASPDDQAVTFEREQVREPVTYAAPVMETMAAPAEVDAPLDIEPEEETSDVEAFEEETLDDEFSKEEGVEEDIDSDLEAALLAKLGGANATDELDSKYEESAIEAEDGAAVDAFEDASVTQQFVRRHTADGMDRIEGTARVVLSEDQLVERAHIAFCPPFHVVPTVEAIALHGGDIKVDASRVLTSGVRIEVKRPAGSREAETIVVAFHAEAPAEPE